MKKQKEAPKAQLTGKSNKLWITLGAIVFIAIAFIVFLVINPASNPQTNPTSEFIPIGDSAVLGDANAPVIIYEFTDFSCPYCQAAEGKNPSVEAMLKSRVSGWEAPVPLIKKNYVDTGKVKIVFKYFPGHGAALAAHAVALGLKEQNPELFWEFAEEAFASSDSGNVAAMKELAISLGADSEKLDAYLSAQKYLGQLKQETDDGLAKGIQGTPAFFINGELISGAQPYSAFEKVIEKYL